MPEFTAHVELRFEDESLDAAGDALRRLQPAAQAAGFDLVRGHVEPAESDGTKPRGTGYGPLTAPEDR